MPNLSEINAHNRFARIIYGVDQLSKEFACAFDAAGERCVASGVYSADDWSVVHEAWQLDNSLTEMRKLWITLPHWRVVFVV